MTKSDLIKLKIISNELGVDIDSIDWEYDSNDIIKFYIDGNTFYVYDDNEYYDETLGYCTDLVHDWNFNFFTNNDPEGRIINKFFSQSYYGKAVCDFIASRLPNKKKINWLLKNNYIDIDDLDSDYDIENSLNNIMCDALYDEYHNNMVKMFSDFDINMGIRDMQMKFGDILPDGILEELAQELIDYSMNNYELDSFNNVCSEPITTNYNGKTYHIVEFDGIM